MRDIDKGEIEALVGYKEYIEMYHKTRKELIGLTTSNGIEIKDVSIHLTTRIFGHMRHKDNPKVRRGVTIEEIKETLTNKNATFYNIKKSSNGISQKIAYKKVMVSIEPQKGRIIQANPYD